jgi:uncharacterized protein
MQKSKLAKKEITKETPLKEIEKIGSKCNKCGHCCSYGSGFAVARDLPKIAKFLKISVDELKKKYFESVNQFNTTLYRPKLLGKPYGPCIFLKDKQCSIHPVKPLQCKTGNLFEYSEDLRVWFALNYQVNEEDPESIRQWESYLKNGGHNIKGGAKGEENAKTITKRYNVEGRSYL